MVLLYEATVAAASDETTAITTGNGKLTFPWTLAGTLNNVTATLTTAQTSGSIFTVDVKKNGTTIFSTAITIDNGETTSATAVTPPVISDTAIAVNDVYRIDVTQVGDGTATGLKVAFNVAPTLPTQSANQIFAGPTSGGAAAPTFRAAVLADMPTGFAVAYDEYTSSDTWTKRTGAVLVLVEVQGGGGGGGSGRRGAAGSARGGGGGGAGGVVTRALIPAANCGATETVTVGSGGNGGAGRTTDNTDGNYGSTGGASSFGSLLFANGGYAGFPGTTAGGTGGDNSNLYWGQVNFAYLNSGNGGNGGAAGAAAAGYNAPDGGGGGGGGGGITTGNAAGNGAAAGLGAAYRYAAPVTGSQVGGGPAGGTGGGNGTTASRNTDGGGGGGATTSAASGNGGNGLVGGGGGGGAASANGNNSGSGGNGGTGRVRVWTFLAA